MNSIPIADPVLGRPEKNRVLNIIDGGYIADGPEVRQFEREFAALCDCEYGIGTANGTTALETALRALDIGVGDRVVTTPFSFVATANAIRHCGATPVFADIDPETYNLDPEATRAVIRDLDGEIDGILLVHLYGLPGSMEKFVSLADHYDVPLIEDAAQAHGARFDGRPVGSFGDAGCFSFYPTKNMTTGEGGMIVTDCEAVAERARRYIDHGRMSDAENGYVHSEIGHNYRMTSLAAAIGREQLRRLPQFNSTRRDHSRILTETLTETPGLEPPSEPANRRHVYHQYTVRSDARDYLKSRLSEAGIGSRVYYPRPIHKQPAYEWVDESFPVAEQAAEDVLSLPVHPALTGDQVRTVAETVVEAIQEGTADD